MSLNNAKELVLSLSNNRCCAQRQLNRTIRSYTHRRHESYNDYDIADPQILLDYIFELPEMDQKLFENAIRVFNHVANVTARRHYPRAVPINLEPTNQIRLEGFLNHLTDGNYQINIQTPNRHGLETGLASPSIDIFRECKDIKASIMLDNSTFDNIKVAQNSEDSDIKVSSNCSYVDRLEIGNASRNSRYSCSGLFDFRTLAIAENTVRSTFDFRELCTLNEGYRVITSDTPTDSLSSPVIKIGKMFFCLVDIQASDIDRRFLRDTLTILGQSPNSVFVIDDQVYHTFGCSYSDITSKAYTLSNLAGEFIKIFVNRYGLENVHSINQ